MAARGLTQTERVVAFLHENPGATSLEITLATGCVNTTGRVSDARKDGHVIECRRRKDGRQGYWLVEGDGTLFGRMAS